MPNTRRSLGPSPLLRGGAHTDTEAAIKAVGGAVELRKLDGMSAYALRAQRAERFYAIGRSL